MDNLTKRQRSYNMSRIHSRDTKPELVIKPLMRKLGFSYQPKMYGHPDFASKSLKIAVFIDGCFWHGCPVCYKEPASNQAFWRKKLQDNTARDRRVDRILRSTGWKTMRFWEHEVMTDVSAVAVQIRREIDDGKRLLGGGGRHKVHTDT